MSYQNDLESFFVLLQRLYSVSEPSAITAPMIRTWLAELKGEGVSARSINRKISTLKSFFKYMLRRDFVSTSPVAAIPSLKVSKRLPSFLQADEVHQLLDARFFPNDFTGRLQKLILELLYNTGIRRNELLTLKQADVDFGGSKLKVLGKGNKERFIPINSRLLAYIEEYCREKATLGCKEETLLVTEKCRVLYPKYIHGVVQTHLTRVSTVEKKSPHTLRHTFATHLTNQGAQINAIKELLGHSSLAATQIYTHNSIERLKEVHKKSHPKS